RASGAAGASGDEYSTAPSISADGRHVAFESNADNLSGEDADAITDVFVRDLDLAVTELVSRASGPLGTPADNYSTEASISADGRYVAFTSRAPLSPDDFDEQSFPSDVFLRDRAGATTILVSRRSGAAGKPSEVESGEPSISADGRYVAFESDAKLTGQRGFGPNAFLRDTVGGTTKLVSVGEEPRAGNPKRNPSVSADGRYVVFSSNAATLVASDTNGQSDIFLRDRCVSNGVAVPACIPSTERVSLTETDGEVDGDSESPDVSADGRYVSFESSGTNLVAGASSGIVHIYVRDRVDGTTVLVDRNGATIANLQSDYADLAAGGRYVSFQSIATNLVPGLSG
ncbi:MAG: TolB family protein, partial [Myxococcota bacterium]